MLILMTIVQLRNKTLSCLAAIAVLSLTSCSTMRSTQPEPRYTIAVHGGAGVITRDKLMPEKEAAVRAALEAALRAGETILRTNGTALDAVEATIKILEDTPHFNAGHGAVLNRDGFCELDAAIMDGATRRAGAVAAARRIRNPIEGARLVMDRTPHILLAGEGADLFAEQAGLTMVNPDYFITEPRRQQLNEVLQRETAKPRAESPARSDRAADKMGTVGAVAVDRHGNLAAGTSTGGLAGKLRGRVGDSPLIGAGTWADNATCAVSATGQGEFIMRSASAHEIASLMAHRHLSLSKAASVAVGQQLTKLGGEGGVIALDRAGNIAMPFNSAGMYRGSWREGEPLFIAIYPAGDSK